MTFISKIISFAGVGAICVSSQTSMASGSGFDADMRMVMELSRQTAQQEEQEHFSRVESKRNLDMGNLQREIDALERTCQEQRNELLRQAHANIQPLVMAANGFDFNTDPHANDGSIDHWANQLFQIVSSIDATIENININDVRAQILASAVQVDNVHGRTAKQYIEERYGNLGGHDSANNKLQQVIGWWAQKNPTYYTTIALALIPENDSTSAMYNTFFIFGTLAVSEYLMTNLSNQR